MAGFQRHLCIKSSGGGYEDRVFIRIETAASEIMLRNYGKTLFLVTRHFTWHHLNIFQEQKE